MSWGRRLLALLAAAVIVLVLPSSAGAASAWGGPEVDVLVTGLQGGAGSTIGPDGALYVTENLAGRITRVDRRTGQTSTFASGLPPAVVGLGGATDVAFIGKTAYALVTLVGPDVGGASTVGIYRVDGPHSFTVIADIGAFTIANPPSTDFSVPSGLQYALEPYRRGFLVTDGHHNRVLRVTLDGEVTELIAFDNIVPTGLAIRGNTVYMAEAGAVPHLPEDGKIVAFTPRSLDVREVASGGPLLVDVGFGSGRSLYGLAQGVFTGGDPGAPASPNTGQLLRADRDGTFTVLADSLNQPTSFEIIRHTAYVVTLGGEILKISNISW